MPSLESDVSPLSVAIIGGGIAGVTLTIALLRHSPHISVTLYESASAFGEVGAGVGFQPNFVRTMSLVHPGVGQAFETCSQGTLENAEFFHVRVGDKRKIIKGLGDNTVMVKRDGTKVALDEEVFTIPGRGGKSGGVHRGQFLDELVKLLPSGISKFEKRLVDVTEAHDGSKDAVLHFADGTTAQHTVVLGCDGIHSRTREIVLGDVEEAKAVFSGKICYRGLLDMSKAVELLGTEKTTKSQMYVGQSGHVLTYPVANGRRLNVISFASRPSWENPKWVVQASKEQILHDFEHWGPSVRAIMENLETQDIWALFNHPHAKRYSIARPRICLVGDAAHASTPHQGAGAGMCIEDAYIMSQLLGRCKTGAQVVAALHAFDFVRRPRTQRLVDTSREAGLLWDLEGDGVGDNLEAFQRNTATRMAWIWDHDITKDRDEAIRLMETLSPTFEEAKL